MNTLLAQDVFGDVINENSLLGAAEVMPGSAGTRHTHIYNYHSSRNVIISLDGPSLLGQPLGLNGGYLLFRQCIAEWSELVCGDSSPFLLRLEFLSQSQL